MIEREEMIEGVEDLIEVRIEDPLLIKDRDMITKEIILCSSNNSSNNNNYNNNRENYLFCRMVILLNNKHNNNYNCNN